MALFILCKFMKITVTTVMPNKSNSKTYPNWWIKLFELEKSTSRTFLRWRGKNYQIIRHTSLSKALSKIFLNTNKKFLEFLLQNLFCCNLKNWSNPGIQSYLEIKRVVQKVLNQEKIVTKKVKIQRKINQGSPF